MGFGGVVISPAQGSTKNGDFIGFKSWDLEHDFRLYDSISRMMSNNHPTPNGYNFLSVATNLTTRIDDLVPVPASWHSNNKNNRNSSINHSNQNNISGNNKNNRNNNNNDDNNSNTSNNYYRPILWSNKLQTLLILSTALLKFGQSW